MSACSARRRCFAALALGVAISGGAYQPGAAQQAESAPVIRTQANLVLVDVVVTARNTAVHGLAKAGFHVSDNGSPVNLTVFEEHQPTDAPVTKAAPSLGPDVYSNLPSYTIGSAANVLLLDALNTPAPDQSRVREQMLGYLANVPQGASFAVFTLSSRLRMVQGFTSDAGKLAEALRANKSQTSVRLLGQQVNKDEAEEFARSGATRFAVSGLRQFEADNTSVDTDVRVRTTLGALQELARYLSPVPGRKNLIWFSGGFPLSIQPDQTLRNAFQGTREYADRLRATDDVLAAARVAVYPVDARGVLNLPGTSAEGNLVPTAVTGGNAQLKSDPIAGGSPVPPGETRISKANNDFLAQTAQEHGAMRQIAEQTGGKAFIDTNGISQAVADAIANGSSYYTVGYVPGFQKYDGALHQLKVNVDGKYQVTYRSTYYADDPQQAKGDEASRQSTLQAAAASGAPPISEILFKVRVTAAAGAVSSAALSGAGDKSVPDPPRGKAPLRRYSIDYAVPGRALAFTDNPDGKKHAEVEFAALAFDQAGKRVDAVDQTVKLGLSPAEYEEGVHFGLPIHQELDLPAGQFALRILIHDLGNTRVGALEAPLTVP